MNDYTIGSIIEALGQEGVKTADVAKAIEGISEKPLRNALKQAGYAFSNRAPKGWHYVGEGEEPRDKSIFDYVKPSSSNKKPSNPESTGSNPEFTPSSSRVKGSNTEVTEVHTEFMPTSQVIHPQFTQDETADLIAMLYEWRQGKQGQPSGNLYEQIRGLPDGDKVRKTIVISEAIGKQLDEFCSSLKVQKSDIIHLALRELFEKYKQ